MWLAENVQAFNAGDWERFGGTLAGGCEYDEPATRRHLEGQEAILQANRGRREAFPDRHRRVERAVAGDGMVMLEITSEGTRAGPLNPSVGQISRSESEHANAIDDAQLRATW